MANGQDSAMRSSVTSPGRYWRTASAKVLSKGVEDRGRRLITPRRSGSAGVVAVQVVVAGWSEGRIKTESTGLSGPLRRHPEVSGSSIERRGLGFLLPLSPLPCPSSSSVDP